MLNVTCILSYKGELTDINVDIDPDDLVGKLKRAIRSTRGQQRGGGLTEDELMECPECLERETYGEKPEKTREHQSVLTSIRGNCLVRESLYFKVMNSLEDVSSYLSAPLQKQVHHVLVLVSPPPLSTAVEAGETPSPFDNSDSVKMTPRHLLDWLRGSPSNSSNDLSDSQVCSQEQSKRSSEIVFPLAGRERSIDHIASCFKKTYDNRSSGDRNKRPIPVCTGVPGLGKTRLIEECSTTIMDRTGIPGKRVSINISFGGDGSKFGWLDDQLGIQCSFAWRVLHATFKAHCRFESWMRDKSPSTRKLLTLDLVLSTIEQHWREQTTGNILVFVGVDEFQKLGQERLNLLLESLCDSSFIAESSQVTLFTMLAGTDLNMARIARTSFPNTERTPVRFLTHAEAMEAIGPYISIYHKGFAVSEAFAQNVFYLGGVPRRLTAFAREVVKTAMDRLVPTKIQAIRDAVLCTLLYPDLTISDILELLATSFTNSRVVNLTFCPFRNSSSESSRSLTWSQMISIGLCLIQDDGCVIVPFHLVPQVLARRNSEIFLLNESELALLSSLEDLSTLVESSHAHVPAWLSWESFGAHFYCIRINSFLVLGHKEVLVSDILRGTQNSSPIFQTMVDIRVAKVFHSDQHYGPTLGKIISKQGAGYISVDWIDGPQLQIVLNGDGGPGVDIFFALKRKDKDGYVVVLDQRKWQGSAIIRSDFLTLMSKIPQKPKFMRNTEVIFGVMSIYSEINIGSIPDSVFLAGKSDSEGFHGSFFDHPGCSVAIDVNSGLKTSIQQLFLGSEQVRMTIAENVIDYRQKRGRIDSMAHLAVVVLVFGGNGIHFTNNFCGGRDIQLARVMVQKHDTKLIVNRRLMEADAA
ncbi:hypothetical protein CcCBS67573_g09382 [Chytriomyces confervae]|uniref:Uncharacterized protein n=1 Tax=Chytriomyces confervae TaxID=246404 RepID=A0A507DWM6_9FUNG|nr:hypothetical protein CcCBS67573_g09382 [Chytriomyces confervae]